MVSVQFGSEGYLFSVVGTSRCDVRAACSGATPSIANVARIFVPPALPSRSTRTLHRMEERAGEGRSVKLPLSSVLSPLLRHGARKKRGGRENLRKSTRFVLMAIQNAGIRAKSVRRKTVCRHGPGGTLFFILN